MMTTHSLDGWGPAASYAMRSGEGDPDGWRAAGLRELNVHDRLPDPLRAITVGVAATEPGFVKASAVACHPCLGRSSGVVEQLPVSVVWEAAVGWIAAKSLGVPLEIGLCIAEEMLQYPAEAEGFRRLGERLQRALASVSTYVDVPTVVRLHHTPPEQVLPIPAERLYGLFTPFQPGRYPEGHPGADAVLEAFRMYCSRYAEVVSAAPDAIVIEGVHLCRSVLLGTGSAGRYLATAALPDPTGEPRLVQDVPAKDRVMIGGWDRLPADWWPEHACRRALGIGLRELARITADQLGLGMPSGE